MKTPSQFITRIAISLVALTFAFKAEAFLIPTDPVPCTYNGSSGVQSIADGASVKAYLTATVPFGSTCVQETRVCTSGVLSGSAVFDACMVLADTNPPPVLPPPVVVPPPIIIVPPVVVDCSFNNTAVVNGTFVTAYQNSTVGYGMQCVSEQRKCMNGALDGSYTFASCAVGAPAQCMFNGVAVAHNEIVTAYTSSSVAYGSSCTTVAEARTCSNGVLSGSAQFATCDVGLPKACLFNGATVAHGASVVAYASSTTQYGNTCASETRICNNGVLSGTAQFGSCTVDQPASCLFNGKTIASGQVVKAYQAASVAFGQMCAIQDRTCMNGQLSGSYTAESCTVLPEVVPPVVQPPTVPPVVQPPVVVPPVTPPVVQPPVVLPPVTPPVVQPPVVQPPTVPPVVVPPVVVPPVTPPVVLPPVPSTDVFWEFPANCGCQSGQGYNMSMFSKDGGKTWSYITKKAPADLQVIWDYMIKKYGQNKCKRPNVKYASAWHKGYVKFDGAYMPKPKVCRFVEIEVEVKHKHHEEREENEHHHGFFEKIEKRFHDKDKDDRDDDDRDDDDHEHEHEGHGHCGGHHKKHKKVEIKFICEDKK